MTPNCDPQLAAELLRALAHPMRLSILCRLLDGEVSVGGFEAELGLRQPSLSQQLGLLREAGLVTARREAKSVIYALTDQRIAGILKALEFYFSHTATVSDPAPERPAAPSKSVKPTAPRSVVTGGAECGVFSSAGWNIAPVVVGKPRNG